MGELTIEMKRRTAGRAAVIAGLFTLIVAVLMLINFSRQFKSEPGMEERLAEMKNEFRENPGNEELAGEIRDLDLARRHSRMRWLAFSGKGAVLLLLGFVVFIGSLKYANDLKGVRPVVEGDGADNEKTAMLSRRFVWGGFAVLVTVAVLVGLMPSVAYISEDTWPEFLAGWPTFRGPDGSGVSGHEDVPLEFDAESGDRILWKSPVPMAGMNSPVVWGDRVFLCGADKEKMQVYSYDANTGKLIWSRDVESMAPKDKEVEPMEDTGYSAPTMAVDGKRVYAIFATGDISAFDFEGKEVWSKNLGVPDSIYGYASSLAMYKKLLIIQYDQGYEDDDLSVVYALDGFSGQIVWQAKRRVANSWASPVVVDIKGRSEVITCSNPFVISYDAASGKELWRVKCMSGDVAPSSIYAGGLVFALEPYNALTAIKPGGTGDVTKTHIAWKNEEADVPDICSPVSNGEVLFMLGTEGLLSCIDVKTGKQVWTKELEGSFQASPSIVDGKLVLLSLKGELIVAEIGQEYKEIKRSKLGERCYASPAFVDGRMYIRGKKNLYCIGKKD